MKAIGATVGLVALSGCASIIDGSTQVVSVKTIADGTDVAGAACTLRNNKGEWYLTTPGTVSVHRSYDDINVKCAKDGYIANVGTVSSSTRGMTFGNILFGGLIGAGVDMGTGAAYDYPSPIVVQLHPATTSALERSPGS